MALSYTGSPYTFTQNVTITTITPTLTNATATACSSSPGLPAGLSINATSCAISGTPTATQTATNYMITATYSSGSVQATISITVNSPSPSITISPTSGPVGTLLIITGTNFDLSTLSTVTINGTSGLIISRETGMANVLVMPGTTTGIVTAVAGSGSQSSLTPFTLSTRTPIAAQQGAKLFGTGSVVGNVYQGAAVALSADGNTVIVGGYRDNSYQGAAWIFTRTGTAWAQQGAKLVGSGSVGAASQGHSVALSADGNTAIIGGYGDNSTQGAAWIFVRSGSTWSQQGPKLVGTGNIGAAAQGISVGLSADGNTAIIGGWYDNANQGASWIFVRSGSTWSQQGSKLVGTGSVGANVYQGVSVGLSGNSNTAIIGGYNDNAAEGAVWIFTRSGAVWSQQGAKLVGSGSVAGASQGKSVALNLDGNTAIIGGGQDNSNQGAAWIFIRSGSTWSQQGSKLIGTGSIGAARQGSWVTLSGDGATAIIGGYGDNSDQGAAWVFTRSGAIWSQQGSKLVGSGNIGSAWQGGGVGLSADGKTATLGGPSDNGGNGATWIFVP